MANNVEQTYTDSAAKTRPDDERWYRLLQNAGHQMQIDITRFDWANQEGESAAAQQQSETGEGIAVSRIGPHTETADPSTQQVPSPITWNEEALPPRYQMVILVFHPPCR